MGRRWGKTVLGGTLSLATASQGGKVAWVVPTYKNGRSLWRWVESIVADARRSKLATVNKTEREIEFYNGGLFGIYSADNEDSIRGESFSLVVLDEAARISETAWTDAIQPTLADMDGDAILISTPRGRNWFWQEYMRGIGDAKYQASWQAPSSANPSPQIRAAAAKAKTRVTELTYRQEWLAEFVDNEGLVFRRVQDAARCTPLPGPVSGRQYIAGVDVAAAVDYTVITILDVESREMVHMDRYNRVDYGVLIDRIAAMQERWKCQAVKVESNSIGQPVIDALYAKGIPVVPFTTTNATKQSIIQNLQAAFERGEIGILNDPVLIGELLSYEGKRTPSGAFTYSAPDGMHDDTVMSLAIAWDGVSNVPWSVY